MARNSAVDRNSQIVGFPSSADVGVTCLKHADFNNASGPYCNWQLNDWPAAVRLALGFKESLVFRGAFVVILAPSLLVAGYSIYAQRPILLVWVAFAFLGYQTSSTGPTGIGLIASTFVAAIGFMIALVRNDWIFFACGIVPGFTWFGSCAILGTTAQYVCDAVQYSEECFQTLTRRGILTADTKAEQSPAMEPSAGPDADEDSSPVAR